MPTARPLGPAAASVTPSLDRARFWSTTRSASALAACGWALLITLVQISLALIVAGGKDSLERYHRLCRWDSGWYRSIIDNGYFSPPILAPNNVGNVGFFPGYPLAAGGVKAVLGVQTKTAQGLTAQAAAWAFWTYLLLFFRRWQLPTRLRILGVLLVAMHPAAFFLVAGYSESLFLTGVLGFLYWSGSEKQGAGWIAAAHGFVMTATRLVGLPVVIFPMALVLLKQDPGRQLGWSLRWRCGRALAMGAVASLGALIFFAYCQWRFGAWDLYAQTQHMGWQMTPNYFGLFSDRIFHIHWPDRRETLIDPEWLNRLSVPVAVLIFTGFAIAELAFWRKTSDSGLRARVAFYFCAFLMFYVPVSSQSMRGMTSMLRYVLCVQVVLALIAVHLFQRMQLDARWNRRLAWVFGSWFAVCFTLQMLLAWRFVHAKWVA